MGEVHGDFLPVLVTVAIAGFLGLAMVCLSWLLGPKKATPYKQSTYECGVTPVGSARERFPIKFYLVAMLFILFDIEVVFLWPWLTVFKNATTEFQIFTGFAFLDYMLFWIIGYIYVIRLNATDWDETTTLAHEKMGREASISEAEPRRPSPLAGPIAVGGGE